MTFIHCPKCGKKIMLRGSGNKIKHFNGIVGTCSKCSSIYFISKNKVKKFNEYITLKEMLILTLEMMKLTSLKGNNKNIKISFIKK